MSGGLEEIYDRMFRIDDGPVPLGDRLMKSI